MGLDRRTHETVRVVGGASSALRPISFSLSLAEQGLWSPCKEPTAPRRVFRAQLQPDDDGPGTLVITIGVTVTRLS